MDQIRPIASFIFSEASGTNRILVFEGQDPIKGGLMKLLRAEIR